MIARIPLTGKQLATFNLRPDICKVSGAQIMGKELIGGEPQLAAVKKSLEEWLKTSGEVTLEMDLRPIIEQIDAAMN
jgi:hypothetical protein